MSDENREGSFATESLWDGTAVPLLNVTLYFTVEFSVCCIF